MPPVGNFVLDKGYDAEAALAKGRAVKGGATDEGVTPVTADTDVVVGFSRYNVSAAEILRGKGASVREAGIAVCEASAAIAKDALVTITANGRVVTATSGKTVHGRARQACSNAGEYIAVSLDLNGRVLA
jgi:hypothetical protein